MSMLRRTDGDHECEWVTIVKVAGETTDEIAFHESEDDARKHAGMAISDGCYVFVARVKWQGGR
jgi:hypothetical protein